MSWRVALFGRPDSIENGISPFALDRQQGRDWCQFGFGRWWGDRQLAIDGRPLAHEQVVDAPFQYVASTAVREAARDGSRRIERLVCLPMPQAQLFTCHVLGPVDNI